MAPTERRVRELGDHLEQRERDIVAELDRRGRLHQPILSALPRQHVRVQQRLAGMAPTPSNGEEGAEFRDDMLACWTADATRVRRLPRHGRRRDPAGLA